MYSVCTLYTVHLLTLYQLTGGVQSVHNVHSDSQSGGPRILYLLNHIGANMDSLQNMAQYINRKDWLEETGNTEKNSVIHWKIYLKPKVYRVAMIQQEQRTRVYVVFLHVRSLPEYAVRVQRWSSCKFCTIVNRKERTKVPVSRCKGFGVYSMNKTGE